MDILFKNGRVIDPSNRVDEKLDILISDRIIVKLGKPGSIPAFGTHVIDTANKLVFQG